MENGKTYTMQGSEDLPRLIPLSVATILARCTGTWCSIEISYYKVYMERCYDLLVPVTLDDKFGNLQLKGLAWFGRALLLLPDRRVLLRPLHHLRRLDELAKPGHPAWHASTVQRDGLKDIYHVVATLYMICSLSIYMYAWICLLLSHPRMVLPL